jgi:hypothetical protein
MRALAVLEPALGEGATTAKGSPDWDETVCWVADCWTETDNCAGGPTYVKHKLSNAQPQVKHIELNKFA